MQESGRLSAMVTAVAEWTLDLTGLRYAGDLEHLIRKAAHFCEFGVLGFFLCKTLDCFFKKTAANGYVLLLALFTAVTDEYIQLSSPGRTSSVADIFLDFGGACTFFFLHRLWQWLRG